MARLDDPRELSDEADRLRQERCDLLAIVYRRRWRAHRMPDLQQQLTAITTRLMRLELEARQVAKDNTHGCNHSSGQHTDCPSDGSNSGSRYWWREDAD